MPTLGRFYGITVIARWNDHPPPHVHVGYQGHHASIRVDTLEIIHGHLPRRARVLFVEWALAHRDELREACNAVARSERPPTIEPLD
ncbi:MAG: DUF4160 domain-containing protein [Jiangellaceae bacterium]